jgi:NAD(P)-dependent dehydrogenase (short-subunit alcohol dehydrogenase family)
VAEAIVFSGEVAVITGAGGGLGRAYAHMLGERGCRIVVNDVGRPHGDNVPVAQSVVDELQAKGIEAVADDHNAISDGGAIIATAIDAFGAVDIVVNNAGIGAGSPIGPNSVDEWRETIDATLQTSIAVTGAAWPHLIERGGGRIVMTGSPAMFGASTTIPYSATKSSMYGFTRSVAAAGRRHGIVANNVMPSALTRLTQSLPPGPMAQLFADHYPPEDVASFVTWLCHRSCTVSGESFSVGGGRAARPRRRPRRQQRCQHCAQ